MKKQKNFLLMDSIAIYFSSTVKMTRWVETKKATILVKFGSKDYWSHEEFTSQTRVALLHLLFFEGVDSIEKGG